MNRYLLAILVVAMAMAAQAGPDRLAATKAKIGRVLEKHLKPSDLKLPDKALEARLDEIGGDSGLFTSLGRDNTSDIAHVRGAPRERVVLLRNEDESARIPSLGYWLGIRRGHVRAVALPDDAYSLLGPLDGEWRRSGPYLIGVGADLAYHQPSWLDGDFEVYLETTSGLKLLQNPRAGTVDEPYQFRSERSMDVVAEIMYEAKFKTLIGLKHTCLLVKKTWKFRDGKYVLTDSYVVQDDLWAMDRLMTAVARHSDAVIRQMIPDHAMRAKLVPALKQALRDKATHVGRPEKGEEIELSSHEISTARVVFVDLVFSHGRWVVRSFRTADSDAG